MKLFNINIPRTATLYISKTMSNINEHSHYYDGDIAHHDRFNIKPIDFQNLKKRGEYIFAFVRNPFDILVSWYCYLKGKPGSIDDSLGDLTYRQYIKNILGRRFWPGRDFLFFQLFGRDDLILTDHIFRFEELDESLEKISKETDNKYVKQGRINMSKRGEMDEYYDEEIYQQVENNFAREMKLFGYDRNGISGKMLDVNKMEYNRDMDKIWYNGEEINRSLFA